MKKQVSGISVSVISCLKVVNGRGCNLILYFAALPESGNLILLMSQKSSIRCFHPMNLQNTDPLSIHTFLKPHDFLVCSTKRSRLLVRDSVRANLGSDSCLVFKLDL